VNESSEIVVLDKEGVPGTVTGVERAMNGVTQMLVDFEGHEEQVLVPADMLVRKEDNTYYLPVPVSELRGQAAYENGWSSQLAVVPVVEEEVVVDKRLIEKGRVRIAKHVREYEEVVNEPLLDEEVEVRHVPINRVVDGPVAVRYEGDTMIVPLLHEVLLVRKRLVLREEVHITKKQSEVREPQRVAVRREEVEVERVTAGDEA
jgi:uncharacterized protein (TIGR02271 family)